jgi:hypothetical protein
LQVSLFLFSSTCARHMYNLGVHFVYSVCEESPISFCACQIYVSVIFCTQALPFNPHSPPPPPLPRRRRHHHHPSALTNAETENAGAGSKIPGGGGVRGTGPAVRARANSQVQHQASSLLPNIDKKATIAFGAGAVRPGRERERERESF